MSKLTNTALSVITTAAAGAALMYLFDPDKGEDRRSRISGFAGDKWSELGDTISNLATSITDQASNLGEYGAEGAHGLRDKVGQLSGYVASLASSLGASASDSAHHARDYASDTADSWLGSASSYASDLGHRARGYMGIREPERHGIGTAAAAGAGGIGMLLLGAGLMYFLDPEHGRRRRTAAVDTINGSVGGLGELASKSGNYIRERASGAYEAASEYTGDLGSRVGDLRERAADAAGSLRDRASSLVGRGSGDDTLIQKAKDALCGIHDSYRNVNVSMADGKLVIDGTVPAAAYDRALSTLGGIKGMPEVVNNLQVSEGVEH